MGKAYSTHGNKTNAYKLLVGKPEGKIPLERPRRKSEGNIKMDFRKKRDVMGLIHMAHDRDLGLL
jgi:hypothetical protein